MGIVHRLLLASITVAFCILPLDVWAGVWELDQDYSGITNPNGQWSYGRKWHPGGTAFDLFTTQWGETGWYLGNWGHGGPSIQGEPTQLWAKDNSNGLPAARWTCPESGSYHIGAMFYGWDSRGVDVNVYVAINGAIVHVGHVPAYQETSYYFSNGAVGLAVGDVIDFVVEWAGGIYWETSWTHVTALIHNESVHEDVTIDEIQSYDPGTGSPASPHAGQFVKVAGVITVPGNVYDQGTHYIQNESGGINFYMLGGLIPLGTAVEVSALVDSYNGEINLCLPFRVDVGEPTALPDPLALTPGEVLSDYDYAGTLVSVTGTVVSVLPYGFYLESGGQEDLLVYIDGTTGIDIGEVGIGDRYRVVSPVAIYYGMLELKPRFQSDLEDVATATGDLAVSEVRLPPNVPNPFQSSTAISFSLVEGADTALAIYDVSGRLVKQLFAGQGVPGTTRVVWEGVDEGNRPVAGGVYFCRLRVGSLELMRRVVVLR